MTNKVFSVVCVTSIAVVFQVVTAIAVAVGGGEVANTNVVLVEKTVESVAQRKCVEMCLRYGTIIFEGAKSIGRVPNKAVEDFSNSDVNSVKNLEGNDRKVFIGGVEKVITDLESTTQQFNAENSGREYGQWHGSQDLSYALHGGVTTSDSTSGHYDENREMKTSTKHSSISHGESGEYNVARSSASSGLMTTAEEKVVSTSGSNSVNNGTIFRTGFSGEIQGELKQSGKEEAYYSQSNNMNNSKDVFRGTLREENTDLWSATESNSKSNKDSSFSSSSSTIEGYSDIRNSDLTSTVDISRKITNTAATSLHNEESVGALFVGGDYGFITTDANTHTVKTNTEHVITSATGIKEVTNSGTFTASTNFATEVKNSEFHTTGTNTITEESTKIGLTTAGANMMKERVTNTASTTMSTNAINREETKSGFITQETNRLEEEGMNSKSTITGGNLITGDLNILGSTTDGTEKITETEEYHDAISNTSTNTIKGEKAKSESTNTGSYEIMEEVTRSANSTTSKNANTTELSNTKFTTTDTGSKPITGQANGFYGGIIEGVTISGVGESANSLPNILYETLHDDIGESGSTTISGSKTDENYILSNSNTMNNQNKGGSYWRVKDDLNSVSTTLRNQSATKTTKLALTTVMHHFQSGEMKTSGQHSISNGKISDAVGELYNSAGNSAISGFVTKTEEKIVSTLGSNNVNKGDFLTAFSGGIQEELKQSGKEGAYYSHSQSNMNNNKNTFHETLLEEDTGSGSATEFNSKSSKDSSSSSSTATNKEYSDSSFIATDSNAAKTNTESFITGANRIQEEVTNSDTSSSTNTNKFTTAVKSSEYHTTGTNTINEESTNLSFTTGFKTTTGEVKYSDSLSSSKNTNTEKIVSASTVAGTNKMTERLINTASTTIGLSAITDEETKSGFTTQETNRLAEDVINSKSTIFSGNLVNGDLNVLGSTVAGTEKTMETVKYHDAISTHANTMEGEKATSEFANTGSSGIREEVTHSATSTTTKNVNTKELSNTKFITTGTSSNTISEHVKGGVSEGVTTTGVGESSYSQSNVLHGTSHNQFKESTLETTISGSKTHANYISSHSNALDNQNKGGSRWSVQDDSNSRSTTLHNQSAIKTTNLASTTTMQDFETGEMKTSGQHSVSNEIKGDSGKLYNAVDSSAISGFEAKTEDKIVSTSVSNNANNEGDFHTAFSGGIQGELKQSGKEVAYYSQSNMKNNKDVFHEILREESTGSWSATAFNSAANKDSSFSSSTAANKENSDFRNSDSTSMIDNSRKTVNSGASTVFRAESGSDLFVGNDLGFISTDANHLTEKTNAKSIITGTNRIQEEVTNSVASSTSTNKFATDIKTSKFITTGTNTINKELLRFGSINTGIQTTTGEIKYRDSLSSITNENTEEIKNFGTTIASTNRIAEKSPNSRINTVNTIRIEDRITNSESSTSGTKTENSNSKFITTGSKIIPGEETNYSFNNIGSNTFTGELKNSEFVSSNNVEKETAKYNSNTLNNESSKGGFYGSNAGWTAAHQQSATKTNFGSTTVHHDTTEIINSGTQLLKNSGTTGFHGGMSGGVKISGGDGSSISQSNVLHGTLLDEITESGSAALFSSKTHTDSSSSYSSSSGTSVEKEHFHWINSDSTSMNTNSVKTVNTGLEKTEIGGGQYTAEQKINNYGSTTNYNRKENADNVQSFSENSGDRVVGLLYGANSNPSTSTVNSGSKKLYTNTDASFNSESHHTINQDNGISWFGKDRSNSESNTIHNGVQSGSGFRQVTEKGSVTNSEFTNSNTVKENVSNTKALAFVTNKNAGQVIINSGFHNHVDTEKTGGLLTYSESIGNAASTITRKQTVSGSTTLLTNAYKGDLTKSVFTINDAKTITGEVTNNDSNTSNSFTNAGSHNYESKTVFGGNFGGVSNFHGTAGHNGAVNRIAGLGSGFYHWGLGNGRVITPSRFATPCQT